LLISWVIDGEVLSIVLSCARLSDVVKNIILPKKRQLLMIKEYIRIMWGNYRVKYYSLLYPYEL
jgi:hypothetical protein